MTNVTLTEHADNLALPDGTSLATGAYGGWNTALVLIAALPFVHTLATWDQDGQLSGFTQALRLYSLPVVFIEIVILWWAARLGWQPSRHFSDMPNRMKWLFGAFCFSAISSTLFISNAPVMSAFFTVRYLLHIFLAGSVVFLISKDPSFNFGRWTAVLSLGAALYVASLTIFCLMVANPQNFSWGERLPSATNIRQVGNLLGLLAVLPGALIILRTPGKKLLPPTLLLFALMTFIMWTGTRGALLGFSAAICIASCCNLRAIDARRVALVAGLCIAALAFSILLPTPSPELGMIRIAGTFGAEDTLSGRWDMWKSTIEAIQSVPFLGHGTGTYRENMALLNKYPFNHPHNFILQFIYDWGIIGGGAVLAMLSSFGFRLATSNGGAVQERFLAQGGFFGLITIGLIEGTLFHPLPMVIIATFIAPHLARAREHS